MNEARPWADEIAEDVHFDRLSALFQEIDAQARGLGAIGFGIMPDVALEGEGSFFHFTQDTGEADAMLRVMITEIYGQPGEVEHWDNCATADGVYRMVARRICDEEDETLGVIGVVFDAQTQSQQAAIAAARQIANLSRLLLGLWSDHLRLELEVLAERRRGDRLQRYAERDPLTRACNAVTFRMLAEEMIAEPDRLNALLLLDVDNFKAVNDVFGHGFGDRYLQQIARAMENSLPRGSLIGRIGGDEFAALVPAPTAIASAAATELRVPAVWMRRYCTEVMERCVAQIRRAVSKLGKADLGSISMGAAIHPIQAKSLDQLFEFADAAVYSTKGTGPQKHPVVFEAEQHDAFSNRLLGARFQKALSLGHIEPYLQPILNLQENRIIAFEALARWNDPQRGLLRPKDFRQVFFDPMLAQSLSETIIRSALSWLSERRAAMASSDEQIAINLTTFELIDAQFINQLDDMLASVDLPWSALIIEVTERVMLGPVNGPVFRSLTEMRARGATIALDDFGTGYGGLQHLKDWPVDVLKIDHTFLSGGAESQGFRPIVRAISDMAAAMGFGVVAEGIESEEMRTYIASLGCGAGQGRFFSRPISMDQMTEILGSDTDWDVIVKRVPPALRQVGAGEPEEDRTETVLMIERNATGLPSAMTDAPE